jgi:hypothetical protein
MILACQGTSKIIDFSKGCGAVFSDIDEIKNNTQYPMIFSGVTTRTVPAVAKKHKLDFYYIDTGYFGNIKLKNYLRVTKNAFQNCYPIIERPRDRLERLTIDLTPYKRGNQILLVPPDGKVCLGYGLPDPDVWIKRTVKLIQKYTDRPIVIRTRPTNRTTRLVSNTFANALQDDVHAVVTYTSNCSVESVLHNIPVINLGPSAAVQASPFNIKQIDSVPDIDLDIKEAWLRHLSYGQFTKDEMLSGFAWATVSTQETFGRYHHVDSLNQSSGNYISRKAIALYQALKDFLFG